MINLILKSYFILILSVGIGSVFMFILGLFFIFKKSKSPADHSKEKKSLDDLTAIAGEDVITTQLDLARAFIETDKKILAKEILNSVVKQGNALQQKEALQLLNSI